MSARGAADVVGARGRVLVEASAGTGKTHRVVGIVLGLVAGEDVPIDRILVATFTRAAAAELRERVRSRLVVAADVLERRRVAEDPASVAVDDDVLVALLASATPAEALLLEQRIRRALERFDDAVIDTIHGFCRRTIERAALDVALDPGATLLEDPSDLLREVVIDLLVEEFRHAPDDLVAALTDRKVGLEWLLRLARTLEGSPTLVVRPSLADALAGRVGPIDPDAPLLPAIGDLRERSTQAVRDAWLAHHETLWARLAGERVGTRGASFLHKMTEGVAGKRRRRITDWARGQGDLEDLRDDDLETFSLSGLPCATDPGWTVPFGQGSGDDVLVGLSRLLDDVRRLDDDLATAVIVHTAARLRTRIAARKSAERVLTYSDLLVALERALAGPDGQRVRQSVRERFEAALVDEFQDTDPVQWEIFSRLFPASADEARSAGVDQGWLRLVGDPKQAIYGFRGADIETYLRARDAVAEDARETLARNWRSDEGLVAAVNHLLGRDGAFAEGGVFGDERIEFRPVVARHEGEPRLTGGPHPFPLVVRVVPRDLRTAPSDDAPLARADGDDDAEDRGLLAVSWMEDELPAIVAGEVAGFLASGARLERDRREVEADPDAGPDRPVSAGDVAILVRTNAQAEALHAELTWRGVPAVTRSLASVFASPEADELLRVLTAMQRPSSDRALRAALATTLVGVTAAGLATFDDTAREDWVRRFSEWAERWRRDGVAAAVRALIAACGSAERLVAAERGERTLTNVRHLTELLSALETAERAGPDRIVERLGALRTDAESTEVREHELRLESDDDAVRVVTVHSAKGLEYPVVWCPYLWYAPEKDDRGGSLQGHDGDAIALDVSVSRTGTARRAFAEAAAREQWGERLRLLYVALTRARHRTIVHTGAVTNSGGSPLHRVLFEATVGDRGAATHVERPDAEIVADLTAIARASAGSVAVSVVEDDVTANTLDARTPVAVPTVLAVASVGRDVDRMWGVTSYTRLLATAGAARTTGGPADEGVDHDEGLDTARGPRAGTADPLTTAPSTPVPADEVPLSWYPAGADAGVALHGAFEKVPAEALADAAILREALRVAAPVLARGRSRAVAHVFDEPQRRDRLADGLALVAATPLGPLIGGARLADVAESDRVHEMRFHLPLVGGHAPGGRRVGLADLAALLAEHTQDEPAVVAALADDLASRRSRDVRGFLNGSIDLVARVDGRYVVADYKSNRLVAPGASVSTLDRYTRAHLDEEMVAHGYVLQELIYVVALTRLLRSRLGVDYDYDTHVAGALYLFVRGMVGPDAPRDTSDQATGVWAHRPSRALVERIDRLFAEGRA